MARKITTGFNMAQCYTETAYQIEYNTPIINNLFFNNCLSNIPGHAGIIAVMNQGPTNSTMGGKMWHKEWQYPDNTSVYFKNPSYTNGKLRVSSLPPSPTSQSSPRRSSISIMTDAQSSMATSVESLGNYLTGTGSGDWVMPFDAKRFSSGFYLNAYAQLHYGLDDVYVGVAKFTTDTRTFDLHIHNQQIRLYETTGGTEVEIDTSNTLVDLNTSALTYPYLNFKMSIDNSSVLTVIFDEQYTYTYDLATLTGDTSFSQWVDIIWCLVRYRNTDMTYRAVNVDDLVVNDGSGAVNNSMPPNVSVIPVSHHATVSNMTNLQLFGTGYTESQTVSALHNYSSSVIYTGTSSNTPYANTHVQQHGLTPTDVESPWDITLQIPALSAITNLGGDITNGLPLIPTDIDSVIVSLVGVGGSSEVTVTDTIANNTEQQTFWTNDPTHATVHAFTTPAGGTWSLDNLKTGDYELRISSQ